MSQATARRDGGFDAERLDELIFPDRIHRSLYVEQAVFVAEMAKVFGGTWTYVAHESEIPRPNDFIRKRLGLRPVLVTRDRAGAVHVLLNRCTHRGATVCRVEQGNARRFACPYHNWTFTNAGDLATVPLDEAYGEDFDTGALSLGRARTESYRGFVFATFNHDLPPLEEHLGYAARLVDQWLDRWPGAQVKVGSGAHRLTYRGNWKLAYDNAHDGYHPPFSHASLLRMRHDRYGANIDMQYFASPDKGPMYSMDMGNGHTFGDQRPEIESYWEQKAPMPGEDSYGPIIAEAAGERAEAALDVVVGSGMNLSIFPNLLIIGNQIQVIEPLGVGSTTLVWYSTRLEAPDLPEEVNILRMRLQEDFPSFGEPDDLANFEECQVGLSTVPEMEWVVTTRYLDSGTRHINADGVAVGLVTDEHTIRAWWKEYKKRMQDTTPRPAREAVAR